MSSKHMPWVTGSSLPRASGAGFAIVIGTGDDKPIFGLKKSFKLAGNSWHI